MKQEETRMNVLTRIWVKAFATRRGQTMTEYVLILAAIALAGYLAYVALEGGINGIIQKVITQLNSVS
jgi:Flp pilus assembly pilin Flp